MPCSILWATTKKENTLVKFLRQVRFQLLCRQPVFFFIKIQFVLYWELHWSEILCVWFWQYLHLRFCESTEILFVNFIIGKIRNKGLVADTFILIFHLALPQLPTFTAWKRCSIEFGVVYRFVLFGLFFYCILQFMLFG